VAYKHVKGVEEVEKLLKQLPQELARRALLSSVLAGSKILKEEVERNAPVDTGLLQRSIVISGPRTKVRFRVVDRIRITNRFFNPTGPDEGVQRVFRVKKGKDKGKLVSFFAASEKLSPSAYGHIQEKGYPKKGGRGRVRAKRYFRRAFDSRASMVAGVVAAHFRVRLEQAVLKLRGGAR